jgi:uncharacterized protein
MRALTALILSASLALPLPALAEEVQAMISVTGTGTVEAVPDIATLSIGVTTQGPTAAGALSANSEALTAVMARLTAVGIAARDMQTSNLSLNPNWTGYDSATPVISGYIAANYLTVQVRDLAGLGTVLDSVVTDGANTVNGLTFGLADPEPKLNDARKEAVADARARAELLAAAAGVKLGRILAINDAGAGPGPMPMFKSEASMSAVPVAGGELGLTANVTLTFEIVE